MTISLTSASVQAVNTIRLTYSAYPLTANSTGVFDALNPINYTVIGPNKGKIIVKTVPDHPEMVDLVFTNTLSPGVWTITVSNVQMYDGTICPTKSIALPISQQLLTAAIAQGSTNDGIEGYLRKNISRAFQGRAWNALIAAIAVGERYNLANARATYDQQWKSTASGIYLDRQGSDNLIKRPTNVGMSDDLFRQLVIKTTNNKLTAESILEVLEIFYGASSVRAICSSTTISPFPLVSGYDLQLLIDGKQTINVIFNSTDFANIASASAIEVSSVITRACASAKSNAYAYPFTDPTTGSASVNIVSSSLGLGSSIIITGGHAQNILRFPQLVTGTLENITTTLGWTLTIPQTGVVRYTQNSGTVANLANVQVGDYFNFFSTGYNSANKGSWTITNVFTSPTLQFVDVANLNGIAETISSGGSSADALFFRPFKSTIYSSVSPVIVSNNGNEIYFTLPATSQAVSRNKNSATYLKSIKSLPISSIVQTPDGNVTITSPNHGLVVGNQIIIDGVNVSIGIPPINAGNSTTTSSSLGSVCSLVTSPTWTNGNNRNSPYIAQIPNGVFLFGGFQNTNSSFLGGNSRLGGSFTLGGGTASSTSGLTDAFRYVFATGSPASDGSIPYTYSSPATAVCPTGMGSSNALAIPSTTKIFVSGGVTDYNAVTVYNGFYTYNYVANTWTAGPTYVTARFGSALAATTQNILVLGGSSATTSTPLNEISVINSSSLSLVATRALKVARGTGVLAIPILNNTQVLVLGGANTGLTEVVDVNGINVTTARMSHTHATGASVQLLPDGRVMVIGGTGRGDTSTDSPANTSICEIYDPLTNSWSVTSPTTSPRQFASTFTCSTTNRVYVLGGSGSNTCEYFNINTGKWIPTPWTFSNGTRSISSYIPVNLNGNLFFMYGKDSVNTNNTSEMLIVGSDSFGVGRFNGVVSTITSVPTANTLTYKADTGIYSSGTNGSITVFTAAKSIIPGPYIYDTKGGVAISSIESTLTTTLVKGKSYQSISVASTSGFPASGYLVFGFGTSASVFPVKYTGILGNTILIDPSFVFTSTVSSGAKVSYLPTRQPFIPDNPQNVGSLYLTDSASGRLGAQSSISSMLAGGTNSNITIKYPGDRGLGSEGFPTHGSIKLSDIVGIFGSDDITSDLARARLS